MNEYEKNVYTNLFEYPTKHIVKLELENEEKDKEIERLNNGCKELEQQIDDLHKLETTLTNENDRLNNIINEILEIVCCIEHNLDKYEEIGGDHLEYATNKIYELKEYIIEEIERR